MISDKEYDRKWGTTAGCCWRKWARNTGTPLAWHDEMQVGSNTLVLRVVYSVEGNNLFIYLYAVSYADAYSFSCSIRCTNYFSGNNKYL